MPSAARLFESAVNVQLQLEEERRLAAERDRQARAAAREAARLAEDRKSVV